MLIQSQETKPSGSLVVVGKNGTREMSCSADDRCLNYRIEVFRFKKYCGVFFVNQFIVTPQGIHLPLIFIYKITIFEYIDFDVYRIGNVKRSVEFFFASQIS